MRWYAADPGNNGPCVFRLNRVTWMLRNPTIEVIASQHRHGTDVEFRASLDLTNPPVWDGDLTALAVRFARGVCCELARQGATIEPASLGSLCPPRTLQKTVARVIVPLFYATVIGLLPVGILVGTVTGHALLGFTVGGWLLLCYLTASLVPVSHGRHACAGRPLRLRHPLPDCSSGCDHCFCCELLSTNVTQCGSPEATGWSLNTVRPSQKPTQAKLRIPEGCHPPAAGLMEVACALLRLASRGYRRRGLCAGGRSRVAG